MKDYDGLIDLAAELGYQLMYSGAEIYRVEESMRRLLQAYHAAHAEVFAIPTCIIVSLTTPEGHPITRMRRIPAHGTDVELLERCNGLCRLLCSDTPPLKVAQDRLAALPVHAPRYSPRQVLLGYGIAPAFFAPLFGGDARDALAAFLGGLVLGVFVLYGGRLLGSNSFFRTTMCSAIASLLALGLVRAGIGRSLDTVTVSILMMLVPGMALTNAMREIMAGDTTSGLNHTADALLIAGAIALGAGAGLALERLL